MPLAKPDRTLIVAAASGLLLAAAFPRPNLFPLAWIALVPLLLVMRRRPFAAGFTAGAAFFAAVLYWLNIVMTTYGGLPLVLSLLAYLFLLTYLDFTPALGCSGVSSRVAFYRFPLGNYWLFTTEFFSGDSELRCDRSLRCQFDAGGRQLCYCRGNC